MRHDLRETGCIERFEEIAKKYEQLILQYPSFKMNYPGITSSGIAKDKWHVPHLTFHLPISAPNEIFDEKNITEIANFTTEVMRLYAELLLLADVHNANI